MGVILQGILGGFSGKVGPVVGGKWKEIDYMRGYVIPSNPNTAGQQAVRGKFGALVAIARVLLPSYLQPFWDAFYSNMSGFNAWISENYNLADSAGAIDETAIMAKGTLTGVNAGGCTYNTATGALIFTWTDNSGTGNALATDIAQVVAVDKSTQVVYVLTSAATRDLEGVSKTLPTGLTATDVAAFVFFYRGTGSDLLVSDSTGVECTAP